MKASTAFEHLLDQVMPPWNANDFLATPAVNESAGLDVAAALYARCGRAIVPVHPNAKNPYKQDWEKEPFRTGEEAKAHWQKHPNDNIGWMMGDEYIALDFDFRDDKQGRNTLAWLAQHYPAIRATLTQRSQSGGWHKVFRLKPEQRGKLRKHSNAKLGPSSANSGLDILTGNAIIVVAPSTTPTGAYRWKDKEADTLEMPDDLFKLLLTIEHVQPEPANDSAAPVLGEKPPPVELDDATMALLAKGWTPGCGHPSPSEVRAAIYRAFRAAGYTMAHIVYVLSMEKFQHLRQHRDTARQPLSGQALADDIKRVLSLPYSESTKHGAGGGAPNPPAIRAAPLDSPKPEHDGARKSLVSPTVHNIRQALGMLPFTIRLNTFLDRIVLEEKASGKRTPLKETDYNRLQELLEEQGFTTPPETILRASVARMAEENNFDSLTEYMNALPAWDGVPRIGPFFTRYCSTEDTSYHTAAGRYLFTALVGRALDPGCKADGVIVLIGEQYQGKTSLVHALAPVVGNVSTAGKIALDAKDADTYRKMQGKTICEIAEMRGFGTREQEAIKDFISSTEDEWVPKYKELAHRVLRRTIFIATTNEREFLKDPTGNRRWFPVEVGKIDVEAVRWNLPQILAEATLLYQSEGVLYEEAMRMVEEVHARHIKHSELHEPIQEALTKINPMTKKPFGDDPFKLDTLLELLLGQDVLTAGSNRAREVAAELRLMGYENCNLRCDGIQGRRWVRKEKS